MMMLVIPIGVLTLVILLITSYVLYKRKKLYGGLYLLSYPPLPDYIEKIDMNGDIHEQIQSLPFIPEWEFPRERIKFSKLFLSLILSHTMSAFSRMSCFQ